jgi:hypothetical protein
VLAYTGIRPEGLRENSQVSWSLAPCLNPGPPEYEASLRRTNSFRLTRLYLQSVPREWRVACPWLKQATSTSPAPRHEQPPFGVALFVDDFSKAEVIAVITAVK